MTAKSLLGWKDIEDLLDRIKEDPGISNVSASDILAKIGPTPDSFFTDTALISWGGLCPGNNENAGKRKSGKSLVTKHHLLLGVYHVIKDVATFHDLGGGISRTEKKSPKVSHLLKQALALWIRSGP